MTQEGRVACEACEGRQREQAHVVSIGQRRQARRHAESPRCDVVWLFTQTPAFAVDVATGHQTGPTTPLMQSSKSFVNGIAGSRELMRPSLVSHHCGHSRPLQRNQPRASNKL